MRQSRRESWASCLYEYSRRSLSGLSEDAIEAGIDVAWSIGVVACNGEEWREWSSRLCLSTGRLRTPAYAILFFQAACVVSCENVSATKQARVDRGRTTVGRSTSVCTVRYSEKNRTQARFVLVQGCNGRGDEMTVAPKERVRMSQ